MEKKSKIKTPFPIRFIGWFFPKLEKTIPWLAERWFVKIFFTPVRYNPTTPEVEMAMQSNSYQIDFKGKSIQVYEWGEGKPILMVHGWMGRATQFRKFIPEFNKAGYKVVAFDALAHGRSSGKTTSLKGFIDVINKLQDNYRQFEMIVGHSLGGVAAMHATLAGISDKLVMISSPTEAAEILKEYRTRIGASERMIPYFNKKVETIFNVKFEDLAVENNIHKLKNIDLFYIHDKNDHEVPVSSSKVIKDGYKDAKMMITSGNGHNRILKDDKVIQQVVSFLTAPTLAIA